MKSTINPRAGWLYSIALSIGLALPLASPVRADASGFEASLRFGYGIPLGHVLGEADLNDAVSGQLPFWLDLGYRVTPELMLGIYGSYGIGFVAGGIEDICEAGGDAADCTAHDIRLGLQAQFHLRPAEPVDPWLGLGVGYEWLTIGVDSDVFNVDVDQTTAGFEFVSLQAGVEFRITPTFSLGPFIAFSLAQFSHASSACNSVPVTACPEDADYDIEDEALHEWFFIGARGAFAP